MKVKTYIYLNSPYLFYSRRYLKTGIEKFNERYAALVKLDFVPDFTIDICDTPFCLIVPRSKIEKIYTELKILEQNFRYAEQSEKKRIFSMNCISFSLYVHRNKHYIIGSIRKTFYDYLQDIERRPFGFNPEQEVMVRCGEIPFEQSEILKFEKK